MKHPLKNLRKEFNLTQQQVCNRTMLNIPLLSRFERGEQIPTYRESNLLGQVFKMEWHQIMELCERFYEHRIIF